MPVIASIKVLWPGKAEKEESLTWYPSHYIKKAGSPKAMRGFPCSDSMLGTFSAGSESKGVW